MMCGQSPISHCFRAKSSAWLAINIVDAANKRWLPAVGERRVNQDARNHKSERKTDMVEMVENGHGFYETFETAEFL
jgi:hypothetical protein